jgi:hypothetical protein
MDPVVNEIRAAGHLSAGTVAVRPAWQGRIVSDPLLACYPPGPTPLLSLIRRSAMSPIRDGVTPLTLIQGGLTEAGPAEGVEVELRSRRCGRCLAEFPGDPDADQVAMPDFWMCPPCREKLLGKLSDAGVPVARPVAHWTSG